MKAAISGRNLPLLLGLVLSLVKRAEEANALMLADLLYELHDTIEHMIKTQA